MKDLASDEYDTILKDTVETVKMFSSETLKLELTRKMPTLMSLLSQTKPEEHTALICMIASQPGAEGSFHNVLWKWNCE